MIRLAWRAALVAGLAGCAQIPAGSDHALPSRPRIVSLNPCTDAILAEVADPSQIAAISHYSHDPRAASMDLAEAQRFRATGGTVEEVLALDPDMVVAGSFLAPATRAALTDLGIRVETFGIASNIADSIAQVRRLASLVGDPQAGEALVGRIEAAARRDGGARESGVLWQAGGIVPGEQALVSELMGRAGFDNHTASRGLPQASYLSLERVLADPPDLLLVAGREVGQAHPVLDALAETRRARFDPSLIYCGGPTIIRAMARLRELRAS